jgi:CRP-like cAMP-binding protein
MAADLHNAESDAAPDAIPLNALLRRAKRCDLRRGEFLFRQGYPSVFACWIADGGVLLLRANDRGEEAALDWCGRHALCGVEDAIAQQSYSVAARATTATTAYCIPAQELHAAVRRDPGTAAAVMRHLGYRLRLAVEHVELLSLGSVSERLRTILRRLAAQTYASNVLPLTQSDLAALAGVSRQSVNQALLSLRDARIAKSRGKSIHVLAPRLL